MIDIDTIRALLRYSDWANGEIVHAAAPLPDAQLDQPFEIGPGSLRKTLLHVLAGESVWLQRWQGRRETPWPDADEHALVAAVAESLCTVYAERDRFLATIKPADASRAVVYRDSKGSLFSAALGDMMLQMCIHSTYHRAQCVNMLRRLGAVAPELDYMMWARRPAQG